MAENEEGQEKTEDPTAKRIEDAYKNGQIPQSREIASVAILFAAMMFLYLGMDLLMGSVMDVMRAIFTSLDRPFGSGAISIYVAYAMEHVGAVLLLFMGTLTFIGLLISFAQVGWHPSEEFPKFNIEKLNPIAGLKKLFFSKDSLVELAKSLLKLAIVIGIAYDLVMDEINTIVELPRAGTDAAISEMGILLLTFVKRCLGWLLVLAVLDLMWQRFNSFEKMKMSKQELKDENKDREGDQKVKAQMKAIARRRVYQPTGLENVADADVVVTNPDHYAIALKYTTGEMSAPTVVARGQDRIAEKIKAAARRHGIPRMENRLLARTLYKNTRVGDEVPPDLYQAVAEILAFVYRLKQQRYAS